MVSSSKVVVIASILGQVVALAITPVLSRVYGPRAFGLLATYVAIVAIAGTVAALRYDLAIPLPKSSNDSRALAWLSVIISVLVVVLTIVAASVLVFLNNRGAVRLNDDLVEAWWIIPIGIGFTALLSISYGVSMRNNDFRRLAASRFMQPFATSISQLLLVAIGGFGLIFGYVIGMALAILAAIRRSDPNRLPISRASMMNNAKRYKHFPIYSTPSALLNVGSLQMAPIILASSYGLAAAGSFGMAVRVLSMPTMVIGSAIGQVFLSKGVEWGRQGRLADHTLRVHGALTWMGLLPLVVLLLAAPELFTLVLGQEWAESGRYAQWMAPWLFFQFLWSPLSNINIILEQQREALVGQLAGLTVRVSGLLACILSGRGALVTIAVFSVLSAAVYLARIHWFLGRAGVSQQVLIRRTVLVVTIGLTAVFISEAFRQVV